MEISGGWYKVAENEADIATGADGIAVIDIHERQICLAKHGGNWYAFSKVCPHAGALLSQGYLDKAGNIVCPLHSYRFSIKSGFNSSGEGYRLKTYKAAKREDGIYVKLDEPGI